MFVLGVAVQHDSLKYVYYNRTGFKILRINRYMDYIKASKFFKTAPKNASSEYIECLQKEMQQYNI